MLRPDPRPMSPIWLSPEPARGLTGGQAQRHADLEGDIRERQRVEIDRMRLAGGRLRNGRALPRVYVPDIDVWRTVKAAAWIRSGAGIGSP